MRLYRDPETGRFHIPGQQPRKAERVEVPTTTAGLCEFLNDNIPSTATQNSHPAFILGRSDAERGHTANPYSSPDLRAEWERGHAYAVESGSAKLTSFASRALPRDGRGRKAA